MSRATSDLTVERIEAIQGRTGVDVFALIERIKKTPDERLRIAIEGARNVARLRTAAQKVSKPTP